MKYSEDGITYDEIYIKALDSMPIGSIISFAGENIPNGWLVCDGDVVSSTDYPDLFAEIGNKYGGTSPSFKLPDLRGRVPVGLDPTDQLEDFDILGNSGGSRTDDLSNAFANIGISSDAHVYNKEVSGFYNSSKSISGGYGTTGGAEKHNATSLSGTTSTLQPYLVVNFIIKAKNTTPTMASVVNATNNSTEDAYSCNYINNNYFSYKVLWENNSPTAISSVTRIELNSSDYNYLEIYYLQEASGSVSGSVMYIKIPKGLDARMCGGTTQGTLQRTLMYVDDTHYNIYGISGSAGNKSDSQLIPFKIIGLK